MGCISKLCYRIIKTIVRLIYPKIELIGTEQLPAGACIIAGNHAQIHGPIISELYLPLPHTAWCAGQMMHWKEVADYAYQDFWSYKPRATLWFYRLLSYLITPLSVLIFRQAQTIAVYHDMRIVSTFKQTVSALQQGSKVVIFPEHDTACNHILYDFQDKFIDVARFYYKKTGQSLSFVPLYIAPKLKKAYFGAPIAFCPDAPIAQERQRICAALMKEITHMACSLPAHTVIPYRNISKKDYPSNLSQEVLANEKTTVDYRDFHLSRLNEPRFSHLKLLLSWVGYFIMYLLTESLIPAEKCHVIYLPLDDLIPFCEVFVIPYVFWYLLVAFSLVYFLLYNVDSFRRLQIFITITQVVAMLIYILYPSRQDLRPEVFPRQNIFSDLIGLLYALDTNTGVFPSLHVAYSIGITSVWLKQKDVPVGVKTFIVLCVILICMSTVLIKQHSTADALCALPVSLLAEVIVYGKDYWLPKIKKSTI